MDNPNDLHHIFGNPDHNLQALVDQFGSRAAAGMAIQLAAEHALDAGLLRPDARGVFEAIVDVDGRQVRVRGRIWNGRARIGSAWMAD